MSNRLKWFEARIGKRVFRNMSSCPCRICTDVANHGLIIGDDGHHYYLLDVEGESQVEGDSPIKYFDTKEEAVEYQKTLKKK